MKQSLHISVTRKYDPGPLMALTASFHSFFELWIYFFLFLAPNYCA